MNMQTPQKPGSKVVVSPPASARREREVTHPGREVDPYPPPERRVARLLLAITGGSALAFASIAYVGFQLVLYAAENRNEPIKPECTEGVVPDGCPEGQVCMGRTCMPERDYPVQCDLGDPCGAKGSCTCEGSMQCVNDTCVPTESEPPTNVCDRDDVKEALAQLKADCAGNLKLCPTSDLQKFAIKYKNFDTLVALFPGSITVHFPAGKPSIDNAEDPWPTGTVEEFYLERLRRSAGAFRDARSIFVIARSSPGGNIVRNELFAQKRSTVVKDLISRSLVDDPTTRNAVEKKFYDFILGHKRRIGRDFFAERYKNRFVTWDTKSRDRLLALISADDLSAADDAWVTQTINQVVLIVPVPCELK